MNDDILSLEAVRERDIDILLVEEFTVNEEFARWFAGQVFDDGAELSSTLVARHSIHAAGLGETDILLIFEATNRERRAILLENKIDAPPQPEQAERYLRRGEKGQADGEWSTFRTCIVAPERYITNRTGTDGYDSRVAYEQLRDWLRDSTEDDARANFRAEMIQQGIEQNRRGYSPIYDPAATDFWRSYWEYAIQRSPELEMASPGRRPAGSHWMQFRPSCLPRGVVIQHKASHGRVDLELRGMADHAQEFARRYANQIPSDFRIVRASKSLAIRCAVPRIDHQQPFANQISEVSEALTAACTMLKLVKQLGLEQHPSPHR